MKVIALNGSPNKKGNTALALVMVASELQNQGIEVEILNVGKKPVRGCIACNKCFKNRDRKCVFDDDPVNEIIERMMEADGIILASPTHWAGVSGAIKSVLDRVFYVSAANGNLFRHKVGAAIGIVRRSGGIEVVDQLNKYLFYSEMLIASSNYWNVIHGRMPGEIVEDEEGCQIMRVLGKNMAYILKMQEAAKDLVAAPEKENKIMTSFVR